MLRLPFLFKSKKDDQTGCNYRIDINAIFENSSFTRLREPCFLSAWDWSKYHYSLTRRTYVRTV